MRPRESGCKVSRRENGIEKGAWRDKPVRLSGELPVQGAERTVSDNLDGLNLSDRRRSPTLPRRSQAEYDSMRHPSEDRDLRFRMRLGQSANLAIGTGLATERNVNTINIRKEDDGRRGRYVARVAGKDAEAELTFTHAGPTLVSADHTVAPASLKGTGAAAAMVDYMIGDARTIGFRIIPNCSYVRSRYEKSPEWRDVMTVAPGETPQTGN